MKSAHLGRFVTLVLCIFVLTCAAFAQSLAGGTIDGTITDTTGAVVPGVEVTAKNVANGATFKTTSNQSGMFVFPVLPVATYDLTAEKAGFAKVSAPKIVVNVGAKVTLPISVRVASGSELVTVTDETPLIETTRTQVSDVVDQRAIRDLPVNGRNFIDFALLTPGVTRDVRTGDISFAGQRGTLNSLTVDGADNNNTFFGQTSGRAGFKAPYQFSQDSVQEFQVASNAYTAELGRAGGAVINVVTKSGTNAFHGGLFEYYRDQSLNAYNPIQKLNFLIKGQKVGPKQKYHFNQFGGNLGGPIMKNKLFFFFDYDGQRNAQPITVTPLPALPVGSDAATTTAYNYLAARAGNYGITLNQNTYLLKLDYNVSQRNQLTARWNRQLFTAGNQENPASATSPSSLEHTGDSITHTDTGTASLTTTLSNSLVNQFRFTYARDKEPGAANSALPEAQVRDNGNLLLTVGRNSFSPRETTIHRQQYAENMTWVKGRNTIKFGGDLIVDKIFNYFPGNFSGVYQFNSLHDFGVSLAGGCQPNCPGTYNQAFAGTGTTGPITAPDMLQPAAFVQDDIRLRSNLTVNLGLRWDYQSVKQPGVQNPTALAAGYDTRHINIANQEWGPRIGISWSPTQKMVVRGGYGIFYGNTPSLMIGTAHSNNGINVGTYTLTPQPYLSPIPTQNTANCNVTPKPSFCVPSIYVFENDFHNPQVHQANAGVEYALTKDVSATVTYLMVRGRHLQRTADQNLGTPTQTALIDSTGVTRTFLKYPTARPNANFARISVFQSNASSDYNGLAVELRKRFSHNFQGGISYTLSKVTDDAPDATAVVPFSSGDDNKIAMYPTIPGFDKGNGSNDQRHRFVMNYVWDLRYGQNLPKSIRWAASGWQWSGILSAQSGQPYSNVVGGDLNGDGNRNDRLPGTRRNQFTLPATWSFDPRISRTVNLHGEGRNIQLFAEAFNLFNHLNVNGVRNQEFSLVGGQLVAQTKTNPASQFSYYGLPTSVVGNVGRVIQLGAKFNF